MPITLGTFDFEQFEVPEKVRFGGKQSLAIHKLPGGTRVVDAMGRDDSEITWRGTFSGPSASVRARQLDTMRAAGEGLALSWDAFCYWVVIGHLELDFRNPWWIPFKVTCVVVGDESSPTIVDLLDLSATVLSDLTAAGGFFDVSAATTALSLFGALTPGTQPNALALVTLGATSRSLNTSISASEIALGSAGPTNVAQMAQSLAQLCCARAFLGRAASNILETDD